MDSPLILRGFFLLALVAGLVGCSNHPDCASPEAQTSVENDIYWMVENSLGNRGDLMIGNHLDMAYPTVREIQGNLMGNRFGTYSEPDKLPDLSERDEAILGVYNPHYLVSLDRIWLRRYFAGKIPEPYSFSKDDALPLYLMSNNFEVLRKSVKFRWLDFERLPDREENQRSYTGVCRATLLIESGTGASTKTAPLTLTYSISPGNSGGGLRAVPAGGKLGIVYGVAQLITSSASNKGSRFYVEYLDAIQPQPVLSDREKVILMMMGETKNMHAEPPPQDPDTMVFRLALHAFRYALENK